MTLHLPWQQSDLHPHALSLTEDAICDEFDTALAADLAALSPPPIIERYRCVFPLGIETETLRRAGFSAVRMTQIVPLPIRVLDHPLLAMPLPLGASVHWFRLGERGPWDQWLRAHWRHYRATHLSNPPREPAGGLENVFIGDDLIEALALRDGPQGRVRSFASLRTDDEIGWIGGESDLLPVTLAVCLRRAAALGQTHATLEVDDDDRALWDLVQRLGVDPSETYVTWHYERSVAHGLN